jgi:hypothetical protein
VRQERWTNPAFVPHHAQSRRNDDGMESSMGNDSSTSSMMTQEDSVYRGSGENPIIFQFRNTLFLFWTPLRIRLSHESLSDFILIYTYLNTEALFLKLGEGNETKTETLSFEIVSSLGGTNLDLSDDQLRYGIGVNICHAC